MLVVLVSGLVSYCGCRGLERVSIEEARFHKLNSLTNVML